VNLAPDVAEAPAVRVALVNDYELVARGFEWMLEDFSNRVQVVELGAHPSSADRIALRCTTPRAGT